MVKQGINPPTISTLNVMPSLYKFNIILAFFFIFTDTPVAYGNSWARGWIGAADTGLHHSHRNTRSKPHLWPMMQLAATPDPLPTE